MTDRDKTDVMMRDSSVINSQTMKIFKSTNSNILSSNINNLAKKSPSILKEKANGNEKNNLGNSTVIRRLVDKNRAVDNNANRVAKKQNPD
jgi:hypothetical protein